MSRRLSSSSSALSTPKILVRPQPHVRHLSPHPEFGNQLIKHGDGAKDVAFSVEDCRGIYKAREMCAVCMHLTETSVPLSAALSESASRT
jgi:hypothetical protein